MCVRSETQIDYCTVLFLPFFVLLVIIAHTFIAFNLRYDDTSKIVALFLAATAYCDVLPVQVISSAQVTRPVVGAKIRIATTSPIHSRLTIYYIRIGN